MAANLIKNPGADTGDLSFWTIWGDTGASPSSSPITSITSPRSFRFRTLWSGPGVAQTGGIEQYFATLPNTQYELSFWINGIDAGAPGTNSNHFWVLIDNKDDGFFNPLQYRYLTQLYTYWTHVTVQFTSLASRVGLRFKPFPTNVGPPYAVDNANWYVDVIEVPGIEEPVLPEGPKVTIGDLLDNVQFDASDFTADYRGAARRWLNTVRSEVANASFWKYTLDGQGEINVTGSNSDGVYPLKDAATPTPQVWAFVAGDRLYDVTNNRSLIYKDLRELQAVDPDFNQTGNAYWWTDYGYNDVGEPLIGFYPRYDQAVTIRGPMYRQFSDITSAQDGLTIDPFFGPVSDWSAVLIEGLRYFGEQNENEMGTQRQWERFQERIMKKKVKQAIQITGGLRLRNLRPAHVFRPAVALADPSHYDNPEI